MAKTFEIERKTKNLEAHFLSIRNKVDIVNAELNDVIELKEGYLLEIDNLSDEIAAKKSLLLALRREQSGVKEDISRLRESLKKEQNLAEELKKEASLSKSGLDREINRMSETRAKIRAEIKDLREELADTQAEVRDQIDSLQENLNNLDVAVSKRKDDFIRLQNEISESEKRLVETRKKVADEIKKLKLREDKIASEETKLKEAALEHKNRLAEFKKRDKDIRIATKRLKERFRKDNPGKELKI